MADISRLQKQKVQTSTVNNWSVLNAWFQEFPIFKCIVTLLCVWRNYEMIKMNIMQHFSNFTAHERQFILSNCKMKLVTPNQLCLLVQSRLAFLKEEIDVGNVDEDFVSQCFYISAQKRPVFIQDMQWCILHCNVDLY